MRQLLGGFALSALVAGFAAAPAAAQGDPARLAQAGPPTSGWTAPGAQAAPAPPTSGWNAPSGNNAGPPSSGWGAPRAGAAPAAPGGWSGTGSQRDCSGEFLPLRADAEKKAAAIKAAAATKKQPSVCAAFKNFAAAEAKVVKYVEEHGAECRIPPDALKQIKANHAKTIEIRTKVCDVAAAPAPRAPSLSDALGTSRLPTVPDSTPTRKSGGTFDTLTGNPLNR